MHDSSTNRDQLRVYARTRHSGEERGCKILFYILLRLGLFIIFHRCVYFLYSKS